MNLGGPNHAQETLKKKEKTPIHIIIKLNKTTVKKKKLNAEGGKRSITYKGTIRLTQICAQKQKKPREYKQTSLNNQSKKITT